MNQNQAIIGKLHLLILVSDHDSGRIKRIFKYVKNEDFFHLTYGDGLSDVNIRKLQECHQKSSKLATLTAVNPPGDTVLQ